MFAAPHTLGPGKMPGFWRSIYTPSFCSHCKPLGFLLCLALCGIKKIPRRNPYQIIDLTETCFPPHVSPINGT